VRDKATTTNGVLGSKMMWNDFDWRAAGTGQWALRPGQDAGQPTPDVEQIVRLVRFAEHLP
jgi:LPS sulfotransferase NodH